MCFAVLKEISPARNVLPSSWQLRNTVGGEDLNVLKSRAFGLNTVGEGAYFNTIEIMNKIFSSQSRRDAMTLMEVAVGHTAKVISG